MTNETIKNLKEDIIPSFIDKQCAEIDKMDQTILGEGAKQALRRTMDLFEEYLNEYQMQ